jgi:hypothetical protein
MLALVLLEEVEQELGLASACSEMDIGQEDGAMSGGLVTLDDGHEGTVMWIRLDRY